MALVSLTIIINIFVDPYEQFHTASITGLNAEKYNSGSRITKALKVSKNTFGTLIMGTSRAEIGFNPEHPTWQERPVYNLSLNAASMDEVYQVFQYTLAHNPPKSLFLSLDLLMFNQHNELGADFEHSLFSGHSVWHNTMQSLLGFNTLNQSRKTVRRNMRGTNSYYTSTGQRIGQRVFTGLIGNQGQRSLFWRALTSQYIQNTNTYKNFAYDSSKVKHLQNIIQICQKRSINLYLIIPPIHALQLETIVQMGLWSDFEHLKKDLVDITVHTTVPVYDFTAWIGINAESLPALEDHKSRMQWYWEASHFKENLGDKVIQKVLTGAKNNHFGNRLSIRNINTHLQQQRDSRNQYINLHKRDVQELWQVLQDHGIPKNETPFKAYSQRAP
ncbi:MAG: hypothetical protein JKY80_03340 [Mariprofundaceae bacterium]|nr:hypothetical protein [Mariprofundaceae bacterium]